MKLSSEDRRYMKVHKPYMIRLKEYEDKPEPINHIEYEVISKEYDYLLSQWIVLRKIYNKNKIRKKRK